MNIKAAWILYGVITVALVALGVTYGVMVWDECREAGHSAMYCWRMVMR